MSDRLQVDAAIVSVANHANGEVGRSVFGRILVAYDSALRWQRSTRFFGERGWHPAMRESVNPAGANIILPLQYA